MAQPLSIRDLYEQAKQSRRPLIGGHRGNPAEHPENTLASFRSAIESGVDMIECDVHLSSDGQAVVIHDHTLGRTTNGSGLVREKTLAELRSLDAGRGEKVPTLDEVVELARDRVGLCIEIKQIPIPYPGLEEQLVSLLRERGTLAQTCVVSFHHLAVRTLKELEPDLQCGILEGARPIDPVGLLRESRADIYSPHWGAMDPDLVEQVHAYGGVVGVWTVDDAAGVAWCRLCRPDSLFTNRPAAILEQFSVKQ
jgi:glycerophosphoryl diester phosphodiesterase